MKWYKHDSNANCDAKLRRVRLKYGMEGYGLYWYCLELIAQNVEKHNLSFELEHDAEIIAADTGIHHELVQEMMTFMIELGLFENKGGIITCMSMLKRLDQSMTSNPEMRKLIAQAKKSHDLVMTNSDFVMPDKNRRDEKRRDEKRRDENTTAPAVPAEFADFKKAYPKRTGAQPWSKAFRSIRARLKEGAQWTDLLEGAKRYASYCDATDKTGTEFVMQAATFCGPDKHFIESWKLAPTKSEARQDKNIDAGKKWLEEPREQ